MIEERSEETPKGRQVGISLAEFRDYRERKKPSERERGRRGGEGGSVPTGNSGIIVGR